MSSRDKRRVFFAARPARAERDAIEQACADLIFDPEDAPRLRWLDAEGWHITLRFVGDVDAELMPQLLACIGPIQPFTIELSAIEVFPSARRPLVIAATGISAPAGVALVESLEAGCRALGLQPERRPWRPHMSLARIRGRKPLAIDPSPLSAALRVDSFVLMESVRGERGNRYVPVRDD